MLALPHGAAETAPIGFLSAQIHHRMPRQKWHQMFGHADRPHARPAAAVRNAKSLVQIQMAHIRPDVRRPAKADLRVHVRAVHVNLPAVRVDDFANLPDGFLEHAVRGRIGDHQRRQVFAMRLGLRLQIGHVDVAFARRRPPPHLHARHHRAGGIGAVRGLRDQADIAMAFARGLR